MAETAHECREALECGGLTPLFLSSDCTLGVERLPQAGLAWGTMRFTVPSLSALHPPKVKAGSSPRTPKPSGTQGGFSR